MQPDGAGRAAGRLAVAGCRVRRDRLEGLVKVGRQIPQMRRPARRACVALCAPAACLQITYSRFGFRVAVRRPPKTRRRREIRGLKPAARYTKTDFALVHHSQFIQEFLGLIEETLEQLHGVLYRLR